MRASDSRTQMAEAAELLNMLEYMLEGVSQTPGNGLPVSGMKITLRKVREAISDFAEAGISAGQRQSAAPSTGASLAERVQQVPGGNAPRTRDLVANGGSQRSQSRSLDTQKAPNTEFN